MKKDYAFGILGIAAIMFVAVQANAPEKCYTVEPRIVKGGSLGQLLAEGAEIQAAFGYYQCNPIKRGDMILYRFGGSKEQLIKIVKAIPGDTWAIEAAAETNHLVINGEKLKTTEGHLYEVTDAQKRLLMGYHADFGDTLPENTYLILSNTVRESVDSRRFGFVGKSDIVAKVME